MGKRLLRYLQKRDYIRRWGEPAYPVDVDMAFCKDAGNRYHSGCGVCPVHQVPRQRCRCHVHNTPNFISMQE